MKRLISRLLVHMGNVPRHINFPQYTDGWMWVGCKRNMSFKILGFMMYHIILNHFYAFLAYISAPTPTFHHDL